MKKFTEEHQWLLLKDNICLIGITDFIKKEIGQIINIDFPTVNKKIKKDDVLFILESNKSAIDFYAPFNSKIIEINPELQRDPSLINEKNTNSIWLFKMMIDNIDEYHILMNENEYKKKMFLS